MSWPMWSPTSLLSKSNSEGFQGQSAWAYVVAVWILAYVLVWPLCVHVVSQLLSCCHQSCSAVARYVMCTYDATVFPANATHVRQSGVAMANLLAMSASTFCHTQHPQIQAQTNMGAVIKHRRLVEDQSMRASLHVGNLVTLLFSKPEGSGRDARALSQPCVALVHQNFENNAWLKSDPIKEGKLGPVPLIPFNEFIGYDETTRPGAGARVEQILSSDLEVCFVLSYISNMSSPPTWPPFYSYVSMVVSNFDCAQERSWSPCANYQRLHVWHEHPLGRQTHHLRPAPQQASF